MLGAVKMNKKKRDMGNRLGRLNGESRILFIYSSTALSLYRDLQCKVVLMAIVTLLVTVPNGL